MDDSENDTRHVMSPILTTSITTFIKAWPSKAFDKNQHDPAIATLSHAIGYNPYWPAPIKSFVGN
ncbi:hypothetical protein [Yoonia sp. R2-816]|uniref:hypothetical protein n=1 Tax=Yoonia sp. R2-816 TaxID=3342638 RepID=UPI00372CF787